MNTLTQKMLEQLLREKLMRSGKYLPETDSQLLKFGKEPVDQETLPDFLTDPEALLRRGYVSYEDLLEKRAQEVMEGAENCTLAARNGQEISEESLQKIIRMIDEGDAEEKTQD